MKKIILPAITALFLAGTLSIFLITNEKDTLALAQAPIVDSSPTIETESVVQQSEISPPITEIVAQEIQLLSEKWVNDHVKPGWLHLVSKWREDYDETGILTGGSVLEKEYFMDEWYYLAEERQIIQGIYMRRDLNYKITQVSVLQDNNWYNLTYSDKIPVPEEALPMVFVWDFGFPDQATRLMDSLEKSLATLDGQAVYQYTVTEKYSSPMKLADFENTVDAIKTKAYYEPESGKLLFTEQVMVLTGGEERVRTAVTLVSWDQKDQPSTEVLGFLSAVTEGTFHNTSDTHP